MEYTIEQKKKILENTIKKLKEEIQSNEFLIISLEGQRTLLKYEGESQ